MPLEGKQTEQSGQERAGKLSSIGMGGHCDPRGHFFSKHGSKWLDANQSAAEDYYNQDDWSLAALISRTRHENCNPGSQSSHFTSFLFHFFHSGLVDDLCY